MKKMFMVSAIMMVLMAGTAFATPFPLQDGNSKVVIDPKSQSGMEKWVINGKNYLEQYGFWYRSGSTGGQYSFSRLTLDGVSLASTNGMTHNIATVSYSDIVATKDLFDVRVTYTLNGGDLGTGTSDIGEIVTVTNKSTSALSFHLFDYTDFNFGHDNHNVAFQDNANNFTQENGNVVIGDVSGSAPGKWAIDTTDPSQLLAHLASGST